MFFSVTGLRFLGVRIKTELNGMMSHCARRFRGLTQKEQAAKLPSTRRVLAPPSAEHASAIENLQMSK